MGCSLYLRSLISLPRKFPKHWPPKKFGGANGLCFSIWLYQLDLVVCFKMPWRYDFYIFIDFRFSRFAICCLCKKKWQPMFRWASQSAEYFGTEAINQTIGVVSAPRAFTRNRVGRAARQPVASLPKESPWRLLFFITFFGPKKTQSTWHFWVVLHGVRILENESHDLCLKVGVIELTGLHTGFPWAVAINLVEALYYKPI